MDQVVGAPTPFYTRKVNNLCKHLLILSVFSHPNFKSLAHCLMPNPINIFAVDELICHKQIVHETLEKFTDRNFRTVTQKYFRQYFWQIAQEKPTRRKTV